jgi:hypothetical protein
MKNLTVSLSDDVHQKVRIKAASAGLSMSRYVATLVEKDSAAKVPDEYTREQRMAMLERFLSAPKLEISENGKMPTSDERNARR